MRQLTGIDGTGQRRMVISGIIGTTVTFFAKFLLEFSEHEWQSL